MIQPQLLNEISTINKEIVGKYENLIYNYEEIIVQPFNIFTSSYQNFSSEYSSEFDNISNNLIGLKNKTNKALYNFRESNKLLEKIKNEGDKIDINEKQRLLAENKNLETIYKYELNQENKLI